MLVKKNVPATTFASHLSCSAHPLRQLPRANCPWGSRPSNFARSRGLLGPQQVQSRPLRGLDHSKKRLEVHLTWLLHFNLIVSLNYRKNSNLFFFKKGEEETCVV